MSKFQKQALVYLPVLLSIAMVIGLFLGKSLNTGNNELIGSPKQEKQAGEKLKYLLNLIDREYVDTINASEITESAIVELLRQLDPHSTYISAKDLKEVNETMEGNFEGVGIEFNILRDTLCVMAVIGGGPSEKAGLLSGDKIVVVDKEIVAGKKLDTDDYMKRLRGPKGTKVTLGIIRNHANELTEFVVERDEIPLYSIDVSYLLNKEIGYIKISRFAETTYDEFEKAVEKLQKQGLKKLIIDLRGNGGGLMDMAVKIADEFLPNKKMIVFTKGKSHPKKDYFASSKGDLEQMPVCLLIDENTASASEILAGAIQDNDRGNLVGRRSFGKGLVQNQIEFPDNSAVRLTVARYFTPTGRCIQKPYNKGIDKYFEEEQERFTNGEMLNKDSIQKNDSLKFVTPKGKVVYGGGGIIPDVYVPMDTNEKSSFLNALLYKGLLNQFCFDYVNSNRETLNANGLEHFLINFKVDNAMLNALFTYAEKNGLKTNQLQAKKSEEKIKNYMGAYIARGMWSSEGFYRVLNQKDKVIEKAILTLSE